MSLSAESEPEEQVNEPTDITFDEHLHPARPRALRHRPRVRAPFTRRSIARDGPPTADNPAYVSWLLSQSMLADANEISQQFSGQGSMWQNPYATPHPRGAVDTASVWFTAYPLSLITRRGESFLKAMANEDMWKAFAEIGIEAIHTGPVKRAGGISGWDLTPSVDGHFDRISTQIDPAFGTEDEFRSMCGTANWYGGTIIDDIVPGHTGKGADFRLAEMKYGDYPGIYHMVEIDPRDWQLPSRGAARRGFGQHRRRDRGVARQGRLHHRSSCNGSSSTPRASRRPTGVSRRPSRRPMASNAAGSICTTSRTASRRSTGSTPRSQACGW